MKNLKLTKSEFDLICRALGIAEAAFAQLRKDYLAKLVNVRGVTNLSETRKEADQMFDLENQFCDLLIKISEKDA